LVYAGDRRDMAISGVSAAARYGVDLRAATDIVELTVSPPRRVASRPPALRVVRSPLVTGDVVEFDQLVITSPERTAYDIARRCSRVEALMTLDALLHKGVVTLTSLTTYADRVTGQRGSMLFSNAIALGEPLCESPMETRCRLVLVDAGLPRPVAQHVVRDRAGHFVGRLDLAYPEHRVGIEYEGDHHRDRATFRRDIARVNALTALGWVIIRVTADDIRHPEQLVRRIKAELATRRAS
jgi:Protein of unknown function (DUF559)